MIRAALLALVLATGALQFQTATADPAATRIHGAVSAFDGQYLTLKADSGKTVVIGVRAATRIMHSRKVALAELKPGNIVGTLALKGADDNLRAAAVRIFPNLLDVSGEGQYPLEFNPARIVTNGTVNAVATTPAGGTLSVTFHGAGTEGAATCTGRAPAGGWGCTGRAELIIARGVPIIAMTDGDTTLLLPGAIVAAFATTDPASLLTASSITVERDGKPAQ